MTRPTFRYPFDDDWPVSSSYGMRNGSMHTGTDFGVPSEVPILASCDGDVIYAAYEAGGAGNTATISGADGWQSRYHHMSRYVVHQGQRMSQGDVVGYCDSTGASSGPHLHFEIRPTPSETTDPIPILEADRGNVPPQPEEPSEAYVTHMWTEDVVLIINDVRGAAVLLTNHRPRKIESVNSYKGPFLLCDAGTFDQYWDDAIKLYESATR